MNSRAVYHRAAYGFWAAGKLATSRDASCPSCGHDAADIVKRKALVTTLRRCTVCRLSYRVPKGDPADIRKFYDTSYREGDVTEIPEPDELTRLMASGFRSLKDFTIYVDVLRSLGLGPGSVVYDYGASWGYGSWQLSQAGFTVFSYEISPSRAKFAAEKLGCTTVEPSRNVPCQVDCFFSAHVIEHMARPREIWQIAAEVLRPDGVVVLFMPNGEPERAIESPRVYHSAWGRVHPLMVSADALRWMATQDGFTGFAHTSPYDLTSISARRNGELLGDELLFVGTRMRGPKQ